MSDYTPTTEEVRDKYASWSDAYPEFDRWLAEHDRKLQAEAWEEGQDAELERPADEPPRSNPYRQGEE